MARRMKTLPMKTHQKMDLQLSLPNPQFAESPNSVPQDSVRSPDPGFQQAVSPPVHPVAVRWFASSEQQAD